MPIPGQERVNNSVQEGVTNGYKRKDWNKTARDLAGKGGLKCKYSVITSAWVAPLSGDSY